MGCRPTNKLLTISLFFGPDADRGNYTINGVVTNTYPNKGCSAEAESKLYGDRDKFIGIRTQMDALSVQARSTTDSDPRMIRKIAEWSSCMSAKGYSFDKPDAAMSASVTGDQPTPKEIEVATADVDCKNSTHLQDAWREVQSSAEKALAERNQTLIQQWSELSKSRIERARSAS